MNVYARHVLLIILAACFVKSSAGADSFSGIVNKYARVVSITPCGLEIATGSPIFYAGERIVIIQMDGATVDTSNSNVFGTITDLGSCGNYEIATIESVNGFDVTLKNRVLRDYDPANSSVQIVNMPKTTNAAATGPIYPQKWNGSTGGVIALEVENELTLYADIIADNSGFAGGMKVNLPTGDCTDLNWYTPIGSDYNAEKGGGIASIPVDKGAGRGPAANGGGGGNVHNAGGGGGGNAGGGGIGGNEWDVCGSNPVGGLGGKSLTYDNLSNKIFMGGGGGRGQENQYAGTDGKSGGGIIIIKAGRINGQNHIISARGEDNLSEPVADGAGGGGAGGAILISCSDFVSPLSFDVRGGAGGVTSNPNACLGPGGGGGGGAIWFGPGEKPTNASVLLDGGKPGVNIVGYFSCLNKPHGAEKGESGIVLTQLKLQENLISKASEMKIIALDNPLDFGSLNASNKSKMTARFVNVGKTMIYIDSLNSIDHPFAISSTKPKMPCTLAPGDTLFVECEFVSPGFGVFEDSLSFGARPCGIGSFVILKGNTLLEGSLLVKLGKDSAPASTTARIPMDLIAGTDAGPQYFRYLASIKFNKTLLSPKFKLTSDSIGNEDRFCSFVGKTRIMDTTLAILKFAVGIGNATETPVEFTDFRWLDELPTPTDTVNGYFVLEGLCDDGGLRLFNGAKKPKAPIIKPNPASGEIEIVFTPIERGRTTLKVYDVTGKLCGELYDDEPKLQDINIKSDISELSEGLYIIELRTPTERYVTKLAIVK